MQWRNGKIFSKNFPKLICNFHYIDRKRLEQTPGYLKYLDNQKDTKTIRTEDIFRKKNKKRA